MISDVSKPTWNYIEFHRYYAGSLLKITNGDNVLWLTSKPAADKQASHHCGKEGQVRGGKSTYIVFGIQCIDEKFL